MTDSATDPSNYTTRSVNGQTLLRCKECGRESMLYTPTAQVVEVRTTPGAPAAPGGLLPPGGAADLLRLLPPPALLPPGLPRLLPPPAAAEPPWRDNLGDPLDLDRQIV